MKDKVILYLSCFFCLALFPAGVQGQESGEWPARASSFSLNAGTLIMVTPFSLTYDYQWFGEKVHFGVSTGIIHTFYDGFNNGVLGFYLAGVFLTGIQNNHFELRLGGSYHPIYTYPEAGKPFEEVIFMPVIALGYRYQRPGAGEFYRVAIGTGGIGLGMGFIIGSKARN